MGKWLKATWKAYLDAHEPDIAMSASAPGQAVVVVTMAVSVYLAFEYVPFLQTLTGMTRAWWPVGLTIAGGACTLVAYKNRCRGVVGSLATIFDQSLYTSGVAFAAMSMRGNSALAMAALHGVVLMYPAQLYALSAIFGVVMSLPVVVLVIVLRPELPVAMIAVISTIVMLVFSSITRNRRAAARREKDLEAAFHAANQVADESVQAALTTTLLTLGHFLHELRNFQTSISSNLEYIGINAALTPGTREALDEAQQAQHKEEELVRATVDDLRARSRPTQTEFGLCSALERAKGHAVGIDVELVQPDFDLAMVGNPEHINVVLLNLIRNSEQAGASRVIISCKAEPSGHAAQLVVHDNGPGIDERKRQTLFDTFAFSTKPGGSGLGLYLVRRYVELLGGHVEAQPGPMGGAAFVVRLPGKVQPATRATNRLQATAE
jgi:signal transduction histidine kinase